MHTTYVATKDLFEALIWNKRCFGRCEGARDQHDAAPAPATLRSSGERAPREAAPREAAPREAAPGTVPDGAGNAPR